MSQLQNVTNQTRLAVTGGKSAPPTNAKEAVVKTLDKFGQTLIKNTQAYTSRLIDTTTHLIQAGAAEIEVVDVIVIGAGLTGLSCAESLLDKMHTLRISVLESNATRVGGQCYTEKISVNGKQLDVDLGASWFLPALHEEVKKLCERFAVNTVLQNREGNEVRVKDGEKKVKAIKVKNPAEDKVPFFFPTNWDCTLRVFPLLENLASAINVSSPTDLEKASKLDSQSLYSFVRLRSMTAVPSLAINLLSRFLFGCESTQVSLLFFLHYVNSNGGFSAVVNSIHQSHRFVGGAQQLCDKLAQVIKTYENASVDLGCKVVEIKGRFGNPSAEHPVVVTCANGKRFLTRVVVISETTNMLRSIAFSPRLPYEVTQFPSRTFSSVYCKAVVTYDTDWWREAGFSGMAFNANPSPEKIVSFVFDHQLFNPLDTAASPSPALVCLFLSDMCSGAIDLTVDVRKESVLNSLRELFANEKAAKPASYTEKCWTSAHTLFPPGQFEYFNSQEMFTTPLCFSKDIELRPLLFFAGAALSPKFCNRMEGAILSGKETAKTLIGIFNDIAKKRGRGGRESPMDDKADAAFFDEEDKGMVEDPNAIWMRPKRR